jgi:hypothetical protein
VEVPTPKFILNRISENAICAGLRKMPPFCFFEDIYPAVQMFEKAFIRDGKATVLFLAKYQSERYDGMRDGNAS